MKNHIFTFALLLIVVFSPTSSSAESGLKWVPGAGSLCSEACESEDMHSIASGKHATNNTNYTICAANSEGQGYRVGFNNASVLSDVCYVAYGDGQIKEKNYVCLCSKEKIPLINSK